MFKDYLYSHINICIIYNKPNIEAIKFICLRVDELKSCDMQRPPYTPEYYSLLGKERNPVICSNLQAPLGLYIK